MTRAELIQSRTELLKRLNELKERLTKLENKFFQTGDEDAYWFPIQSIRDELVDVEEELKFIKEELYYDNVLREKGLT